MGDEMVEQDVVVELNPQVGGDEEQENINLLKQSRLDQQKREDYDELQEVKVRSLGKLLCIRGIWLDRFNATYAWKVKQHLRVFYETVAATIVGLCVATVANVSLTYSVTNSVITNNTTVISLFESSSFASLTSLLSISAAAGDSKSGVAQSVAAGLVAVVGELTASPSLLSMVVLLLFATFASQLSLTLFVFILQLTIVQVINIILVFVFLEIRVAVAWLIIVFSGLSFFLPGLAIVMIGNWYRFYNKENNSVWVIATGIVFSTLVVFVTNIMVLIGFTEKNGNLSRTALSIFLGPSVAIVSRSVVLIQETIYTFRVLQAMEVIERVLKDLEKRTHPRAHIVVGELLDQYHQDGPDGLNKLLATEVSIKQSVTDPVRLKLLALLHVTELVDDEVKSSQQRVAEQVEQIYQEQNKQNEKQNEQNEEQNEQNEKQNEQNEEQNEQNEKQNEQNEEQNEQNEEQNEQNEEQKEQIETVSRAVKEDDAQILFKVLNTTLSTMISFQIMESRSRSQRRHREALQRDFNLLKELVYRWEKQSNNTKIAEAATFLRQNGEISYANAKNDGAARDMVRIRTQELLLGVAMRLGDPGSRFDVFKSEPKSERAVF